MTTTAPDADERLLQLAARLWAERQRAMPRDEGSLELALESAPPALRNPIVEALFRCGYARFVEALRPLVGDDA